MLGLLAVPLLFPSPDGRPFCWSCHCCGGWWRRPAHFFLQPAQFWVLLIPCRDAAELVYGRRSASPSSLDKISGLVFSLAVFFLGRDGRRASIFRERWLVFLLGGLATPGLAWVSTDWPSKIPYVDRLAGQLPGWVKSLPLRSRMKLPSIWVAVCVLVLFVPLAAVLAVRGAYVWRRCPWTNRLGLGLVTTDMGVVTLFTLKSR